VGSRLGIVNPPMPPRAASWLLAATLAPLLSCTTGDRSRTRPPLRAEDPLPTVSLRPVGWPYWVQVPVTIAPQAASFALPLAPTSVDRPEGAEALWSAASPALRARILAQGFARVRPRPRRFGFGELYEGLVAGGVPCVITVDTLFAVSIRAIDAALADVEAFVVSAATRTLLERIDRRLAAAASGEHPDLTDGLRMAAGVVAVARGLLDASYTPRTTEAELVAAETRLVRAHAGVAPSPILRLPLDYAVFAPRGATVAEGANTGPYLAAQWLAAASFAFSVGDGIGRVDVAAARARARAALLVARLVMDASDSDAPARQALQRLDRLGELAFGDPAGASPLALADLAVARGFDLHDAKLIADVVPLERMRHVALDSVGSMELLPLRRAPETSLWRERVPATGGGARPGALDVITWIGGAAGGAAGVDHHASFYGSALDAIGVWLAPSMADAALPGARGDAWHAHRVEGALAAWTLLRHASVPYARAGARPQPAVDAGDGRKPPSTLMLVEPHPEAIAAMLGLVQQVSKGAAALDALAPDAPSHELLAEAQSMLEIALAAASEEAEGPSSFTSRAAELEGLPRRLSAIEARTSPLAGPAAAVVYSDARSGQALEEGTLGIDTLYAVLPDPRTGRPELFVGGALAQAELWVASGADATDAAWAARLAAPGAPVEGAFAGTLDAP